MTQYLRNDNHVYRQIAGEDLLVSVRRSTVAPLYALTPTAASLWARLGEWCTVADLAECLTASFAVDADVAARDVSEFLDQLDTIGALAVREQSS